MEDLTSHYDGKTVLVTGGAGAIGGNLVRRLAALPTKRIIILDNFSSAYRWNVPTGPKIQLIEGDILDDKTLTGAFKKKPHIVFHLAAHFANQNSVDNPETNLMVNGMGILKVLQLAQTRSVSRFVYASSGCGVYGPDSRTPFTESDVTLSLNTPYQVTKVLGELYTNYYYNLYGLPIVNARFFNSYGPGEVPGRYRNVIPNFFYWAMSGKALPITGDGTETRDWTYVGDIVDGLLSMGIRDEAVGEAINLGAGTETRVIDLANEVNRLTGNRLGVVHRPRRDWDAKLHIIASIEKAQRLLDYRPQMTFTGGLKAVYAWFNECWDDIERSADFEGRPGQQSCMPSVTRETRNERQNRRVA